MGAVLSTLESIIQEVKSELIAKNQIREETHESMRKATSLSKQAILLIHQKRFDDSEKMVASAREKIVSLQDQAKQYPEIRYFEAIPGIGFISAATISAILETPHRFADKKKVWMYAGLGITTRSSGGKTYSEKLSTDYNRLLKYTLKQAAEAAIRAADNPFQRKYLDMTVIHGIAPHRAKLTIARDMLATMWAMWRKGEKYSPAIREKSGLQTGLGRPLS